MTDEVPQNESDFPVDGNHKRKRPIAEGNVDERCDGDGKLLVETMILMKPTPSSFFQKVLLHYLTIQHQLPFFQRVRGSNNNCGSVGEITSREQRDETGLSRKSRHAFFPTERKRFASSAQ